MNNNFFSFSLYTKTEEHKQKHVLNGNRTSVRTLKRPYDRLSWTWVYGGAPADGFRRKTDLIKFFMAWYIIVFTNLLFLGITDFFWTVRLPNSATAGDSPMGLTKAGSDPAIMLAGNFSEPTPGMYSAVGIAIGILPLIGRGFRVRGTRLKICSCWFLIYYFLLPGSFYVVSFTASFNYYYYYHIWLFLICIF